MNLELTQKEANLLLRSLEELESYLNEREPLDPDLQKDIDVDIEDARTLWNRIFDAGLDAFFD